MPSNNSKYTEEMREQTAQYIIESGKSATSVAEELGINKNTVCSWVRAYRRKHNMPTYAELAKQALVNAIAQKGVKEGTYHFILFNCST